jgi:hypothetical protein
MDGTPYMLETLLVGEIYPTRELAEQRRARLMKSALYNWRQLGVREIGPADVQRMVRPAGPSGTGRSEGEQQRIYNSPSHPLLAPPAGASRPGVFLSPVPRWMRPPRRPTILKVHSTRSRQCEGGVQGCVGHLGHLQPWATG